MVTNVRISAVTIAKLQTNATLSLGNVKEVAKKDGLGAVVTNYTSVVNLLLT